MKANYEEDKVIVSATEPTGVNRKKVWFKKGKNLFNKNNFDWMWCFINGGTGEISQYTNVTKMFIIPIETGKIYTVSKIAGKHFRVGTTKTYPTIGMIVDNRDVNNNGTSITISTGSEAKYLVCSYFQDGVDTLTATEIEATIQVEQNLTATACEQYIEPEIYILNNNNVYEKMYGNSIIESGENEYFKYIKFSDGTLIQYGTMIFNNLTWNSWGSLYYAECNVSQYKFPVPFIGRPVVNGSIAHGTGSGDGWISRIGGTSTTDIESLAIARPTTYADSMYVNITAIGRWK